MVEKAFISAVMDNVLMTVSVWGIIVGTSLIIMTIPICGLIGTVKESKCLLTTYMAILIIVFLLFLMGGIVCFVLRGQIGEWVSVEMETTLRNDYGVDLENAKNRLITQAWDMAQEEMYCCGVREQSWNVYRRSNWYSEQSGILDATRPYVPRSCCRRDQYGQLINSIKCQTNMQGPPYRGGGQPGSITYNEALHYRGCYEAGKDWIWHHTSWLIGFGFGFGALLILAVVITALLITKLRR